MPLFPPSTGGSALTYPTLAWNQYTTAYTVAGEDFLTPPLDTANDATLANPAGWTITAGSLALPNGVFSVVWYWESATAAVWSNYAIINGTELAVEFYATAPQPSLAVAFGSVSFTVKLTGAGSGNTLAFSISNIDTNPHDILNLITVTRLDT